MPHPAPPSLDIVLWVAAEVSSTQFPVVPLVVVGLVVVIATTAVFTHDPERRKTAMEILRLIFRWWSPRDPG